MLEYSKSILYSLILLFLLANPSKTTAQRVGFNTQLNFSATALENFISTIAINQNQVYFIANNNNLYCYNKDTNKLLYTKELKSKTNTKPFFDKNLLLTNTFENQKYKTLILDKNTGEIIQKINLSFFKTQPFFVNNNLFVTTIIDDNGGQLVGYDLKKDKMLWSHFVGHGATKDFYIQNNSILANFDYNQWKSVTYDGVIVKKNIEELETENNNKPEPDFFALAHDKSKITLELLHKHFSDLQNLKIQTNETATVLLNAHKLVVLTNDLKVVSNIELNELFSKFQDFDNDYLEILKMETENVWFFFRNQVVNYNFKKNNRIKTYNLTNWNAHQAILDNTNLWLVSKTDGQLFKIKLELTKRELAEEKAKMEQYKCRLLDEGVIEAIKRAKEQFNNSKN